MIGYLQGAAIDEETLLVDGVGYVVSAVNALTAGESYSLWVRTVVRENDISLFGFTQKAERSLFDALTKVTGVGPKVAIGILGIGSDVVASAIRDGDAKALAKAPGVGPKKAAIIVSSATLPADVVTTLATGPDPRASVVDALTGLGFNEHASRQVVADLVTAGVSTDESVLLRRAMAALRN